MEVTLTEEEAAEFTLINRAAVDHMMLKAQEPNASIPPCWLCMSDEARSQARENVVSLLNERMKPVVPMTQESVTAILDRTPGMQDSITMWRKAELALKKEREGGNPRAFFME